METLEEEKDTIIKKSIAEIVPVHLASQNDWPIVRRSKNFRDQDTMKVIEECKDISLEQNEENDTSQWLWDGSLGDKGTILVFRSCVLASKANSSRYVEVGDSSKISDSKKTYDESEVILKNPYNVIEPFGSPVCEWDSEIYEEMSDSSVSEKKIDNPNDKRKRDIRDVFSDVNKVTSKKKININTSDPTSYFNTGRKSTDSVPNIPSIHKSQHKWHNPMKGKLTLSSKSTSLPSTMDQMISDKDSFDLDPVFSVSSKIIDFNNIVIPEKHKMPAAILHITYKTAMAETKLLNKMLQAHGLTDVDAQSKDFNLMWSGLHPKPDVLRSLASHQRVNHFPRSYELTRKDKLFKNIEKMQYFRGSKNFDFIPLTFLMPVEYKELCTTHYRIKGPWIVKPAASSRGRGIYIVNTPDQIPKGESVVVAKYIDKPLLVDGHKCDLRLYVCVTSFDPLLIYMYEEGLVRFATVKYDKSNKSLWNPCMHLCNYSINKYHSDYIKCDDPCAENVGHKWTLSAFLRHLRREGHDTAGLMSAIEDVVVKSILSCTQSIASASRMFVPYFSNCFELYGFDILIDDSLKPWLLEINLSPSLGCDSPLDVRLKSALLADTLNLVGIPAIDPMTRSDSSQQSGKPVNLKMRIKACRRVHSAESMSSKKKGFGSSVMGSTNGTENGLSILTNEEARIIKLVKAQYQRRGGYVRIFPSQDSWKKYAQYLDPVSGVPVCSISAKGTLSSIISHNYNLLVHTHVLPNFDQAIVSQSINNEPPERLKRYERILPACTRVTLDGNSSPNSAHLKDVSSAKKVIADSKKAKTQLKQQILRGTHISLGESRRAFSMFLMFVLKRISNSTTEQSAQHADLILRFLKKASHTLKMPYNIKSPSQKMSDKDKAAVIAKQLNDFLHIYHRETDLWTDSLSRKEVNNASFTQFMYNASEADLEEILLIILKREGNVAPFLGDKLTPMCVDIPPTTTFLFSGKDAPLRHQLLRYLAYVTPVHSRRFKPPTQENVCNLPPLSNGSPTYYEAK